jgi:hypothetical protein
MNRRLAHLVRRRAENRCEYCGQSADAAVLAFPIDHIIARQHGGRTTAENLALACPLCNLLKGTNLTGVDPLTGSVTRLYHPRHDRWSEHFYRVGAHIVGRTDVGRTTVALLDLNSEERLALRQAGPSHPPSPAPG